MKNTNTVTVIIPAYNMEAYIEKSVETVRRQTYKELEILIVDDGSTDNTRLICDHIAESDNRVRVLHKQNEGLSAARNYGLDNSSGHYIAFLDADDAYHPRFIEILLDYITLNDCDIAQCDYLCTRDTQDHAFSMANDCVEIMNGEEAALRCCSYESAEFIVAWNKIYKKSLFDGMRYPIGMLHEDQFLTWKILLKAKSIVYVHAFLYMYLQRRGSLTGGTYSKRRLQIVDAYVERSRYFHSRGYHKEALNIMRSTKEELLNGIDRLKTQDEDITGLDKKLIEVCRELKDREDDYYVLPYELLRCYRTVVIYGAGLVGKAYYRQAQRQLTDKRLILVDRYSLRDNEDVMSLDYILEDSDAGVIIAIEDSRKVRAIKDMLIRMGVKNENIIWVLGYSDKEKKTCELQ